MISVASRLDPDKAALFRCLADLVEHLAQPGCPARHRIRLLGAGFYGDTRALLAPLLERARAVLRMVEAGWVPIARLWPVNSASQTL